MMELNDELIQALETLLIRRFPTPVMEVKFAADYLAHIKQKYNLGVIMLYLEANDNWFIL